MEARFRLGVSAETRRLLGANAALRDRHQGERCFVLATGPSIRGQDLSRLRGEHCIAVSNFFVHPDFAAIAPRYYCVAPFHAPLTEEAWQAWIGELASALAGNPGCTVFFTLADRERVRRVSGLGEDRVRYLWLSPHARPRRADLARPALAPQSVTVMALQVALHLGFSEIQLLGCDHDWILHLNESRHFYAEHEHGANRAGYDEWFGADFASYCEDYVRLWQQYRLVQAMAGAQGARILNATAGGVLDVFPRVAFPPPE